MCAGTSPQTKQWPEQLRLWQETVSGIAPQLRAAGKSSSYPLPATSIPREGRKLPRARPSGAPGQGKGAEVRCPAGGLAQMQPLACTPGQDEAAGGMVLEGLGRSCWPHDFCALQRGPRSHRREEDALAPSLWATPWPSPVSLRARDQQAGKEPCRGIGLASFPAAPRRLGQPRHSPALSSRFRRASAGPSPRSPLLTAGPRRRAPCSAMAGMLSLGRDPGRSGSSLRLHPSPLPSARGLGKGVSAEANPSSSSLAVTGRKFHYNSFQRELYRRASALRFPQAS